MPGSAKCGPYGRKSPTYKPKWENAPVWSGNVITCRAGTRGLDMGKANPPYNQQPGQNPWDRQLLGAVDRDTVTVAAYGRP